MTSNSNIEIILMKYATAVLDAKNGVTNPTLGEMIDPAVEAIQQELLKARIDELNRYDTDEDMYKTLRTVDLQAKLKGDE